jgi:hypothetical protein
MTDRRALLAPLWIGARVAPADNSHGALKLWFIAEERKMVFNTCCRFVAE